MWRILLFLVVFLPPPPRAAFGAISRSVDTLTQAPQVVATRAQVSSNARVHASTPNVKRDDRDVATRTGATTNVSAKKVNARATTVKDSDTERVAVSRATTAPVSVPRGSATRSRGEADLVVSRAATTKTKSGGVRSAVTQRAATNQPVNDRIVTRAAANRPSTRSAAVKSRVATSEKNATEDGIKALMAAMGAQSEMSDFCKTKYAECMDNFCNVLDEKLGRCSCSKNIKNYEKTENGLKQATDALQDVAQQIQYIGLTANEIDTLFSETEAESVMSGTSDNSQLKNDLDKIKGLIVDIKPGTSATSDVTAGVSVDLSGVLDFDFSSSGFDIGTLFGTSSASTSSISNQRGEQLYKTAAARCKKDVLDQCKKQNVDISVVTNSYDMTIDRACIAYERSLKESNEEMLQTVRNAQNVLQRARLTVAQQKNVYDLRGCISALDSCMTDDYVCGADYEKCLDPTGKYIVDGAIVVGAEPGRSGAITSSTKTADGLWATWNYDGSNAWGTGNVGGYLDKYLTGVFPETGLTYMANYLHNKIGRITDDGRAQGMCVAVLNRCRDYTYTNSRNGKYIPNNRVIREWMERTLVKIKNAQDSILASYAESCISDVELCLDENDFDGKDDTKSNIAINACRAQILTCKSVNGDLSSDLGALKQWVYAVMGVTTGGGNQGSKITISYNTGGGSAVSGGTCTVGGTFTLPAAPTRSGYAFSGWSVNGTTYGAKATVGCNSGVLGKSSGTVTIEAKWSEANNGGGDSTSITVLFEGSAECSVDALTEKSVTCNYDSFLMLPDLKEPNCIWDVDGTQIDYNQSIKCNELGVSSGTVKIVLSPRMEQGGGGSTETITISYNTDGGSAVSDGTCTVDGTFTLPAAPTRSGYAFSGWSVNGTTYGANATVECSGDTLGVYGGPVTIDAMWTEENTGNGDGNGGDSTETITISYNTGGGSAVSDGTCTVDGTFTLPAAPTRDGYAFRGWSVNGTTYGANATVECNGDTLGVYDGPVTIDAMWTEENTGNGDGDGGDSTETITISYNTGGGSAVSGGTCTVDGTFTLPAAPTRDGYAFGGWSVAGIDEVYQIGDDVPCVGDANNTMKLTAVWVNIEDADCHLTFTVLGEVYKEVGLMDGQSFSFPYYELQQDGYKDHNSWKRPNTIYGFSEGTKRLCTEEFYGQITFIRDMEFVGECVTLWYDTQGGDTITDTYTCCTEESAIPPMACPTKRSGYRFAGWTLDGAIVPRRSNFDYCPSDSQAVEHGRAIYAVWADRETGDASGSNLSSGSYTVHFLLENSGEVIKECNYGEELTLPYAVGGVEVRKWKINDSSINVPGDTIVCGKASFGIESGEVYVIGVAVEEDPTLTSWIRYWISKSFNDKVDSATMSSYTAGRICRIGETFVPSRVSDDGSNIWNNIDREGYDFIGVFIPNTRKVMRFGTSYQCDSELFGVDHGDLTAEVVYMPKNVTNLDADTKITVHYDMDNAKYGDIYLYNIVSKEEETSYDNDTCNIGGTLTLPDVPKRPGYAFARWVVGYNKYYPAGATIDCDDTTLVPVDGVAVIRAEWHIADIIQVEYWDETGQNILYKDQHLSGDEITIRQPLEGSSGWSYVEDGVLLKGGEKMKIGEEDAYWGLCYPLRYTFYPVFD